jgi:uncharacterized protein (DUF488 family)
MKRATSTRVTARAETAKSSPLLLTVGHSTRTLESFIALLQAHRVSLVADVRTIPRSRHCPQFNAESLPKPLKKAGIGYTHLAALGGLRHTSRASVNTGWRNASFRGFADYMQTPDFERGLTDLVRLTRRERLVLMCAEAVPWRCHRSLIADALLVRGLRVEHITSLGASKPHKLTPFARVTGERLTYPPPRN